MPSILPASKVLPPDRPIGIPVPVGGKYPVMPLADANDPAGSGASDSKPLPKPTGHGLLPDGSSGGGSNSGGGDSTPHLHGLDDVWSMGPGQGCQVGLVEQSIPGGAWTCITQSDFQKIQHGDFSPLVKWWGDVFKHTTAGSDSGTPSDAAAVPPNDPTQRLLDLAALFGTGGGGGGSGSGVVALPTGIAGDTATAPDAAASSSGGHVALLLVGVVVVGVAFWYYNKHKKKAAA